MLSNESFKDVIKVLAGISPYNLSSITHPIINGNNSNSSSGNDGINCKESSNTATTNKHKNARTSRLPEECIRGDPNFYNRFNRSSGSDNNNNSNNNHAISNIGTMQAHSLLGFRNHSDFLANYVDDADDDSDDDSDDSDSDSDSDDVEMDDDSDLEFHNGDDDDDDSDN